jgi:hypothetical protein
VDQEEERLDVTVDLAKAKLLAVDQVYRAGNRWEESASARCHRPKFPEDNRHFPEE